jgi:hypothetical protein
VRGKRNNGFILGDKLTAFGPHTTGGLYGISKELEIIKQLYDIGALFDRVENFGEVKETYQNVVATETKYRGWTPKWIPF